MFFAYLYQMIRFCFLWFWIVCFPLLGLADAGPKPVIDFQVTYLDYTARPVDGWLLVSDSEDFSREDTLPRRGPQGFQLVSAERFRALFYGMPAYMKLKLKMNDGSVKISNVFSGHAVLNHSFSVVISTKEVIVTEDLSSRFSSFFLFLKALLITIVLESLVGYYMLKHETCYPKLWKEIIFINLVTVPIVWAGVSVLNFQYYLVLELIPLVSEA